MAENFDVFDFELSADEIAAIDAKLESSPSQIGTIDMANEPTPEMSLSRWVVDWNR